MAQSFLNKSSLRLVYDYGMDADGKPVFKSKSYANIKTEATADQLLAAATALSALSSMPLMTLERNDTSSIS